jgi:hypothetical protein
MPATLRYPHYLLLLALALGICADSLFYQRWPGISIPLFVALCLAALGGISRLEDRPPTRANLWMGGAALGFAICLMLRATPLLIVRENVARYQESGKLDAFYLTTLSNDAIPALVDALAVVEDPERKIILRELGWRHSHLSAVAAESGWPGWHLARARAVAATTPIAAAMNEEQME